MKNKWTPNDMPDQTGKVIIITGANSGLGLASAKKLAERGAQVIMACRSEERGQEALKRVVPRAAASPRLMLLDLADLESVQRFAQQFKEEYSRLDVLLNNAGIMATPYGTTREGFEKQIGVNHLGHFALTGHLFALLLATPGSRIVNVSSLAARNGTINTASFREPEDYKPWAAYGQSKLANLMFTRQLQERLDGQHTLALAAHPGGAATNLGRNVQNGPIMTWVANNILLPLLPTADQNARPQLYAATAADVTDGAYYGPGGWGQIAGAPKSVNMPETLGSPTDWKELWKVSEKLTGVVY